MRDTSRMKDGRQKVMKNERHSAIGEQTEPPAGDSRQQRPWHRTIYEFARAIYAKVAPDYRAARADAIGELVARIRKERAVEWALEQFAGLLLDSCMRNQNVAPYRRAAQRAEMTAEPFASFGAVVTGDAQGTGRPQTYCLSQYRELLDVHLKNRKRVRDATRAELLAHCEYLETQAKTNLERAARLRALAALLNEDETVLTALCRLEKQEAA